MYGSSEDGDGFDGDVGDGGIFIIGSVGGYKCAKYDSSSSDDDGGGN